MQFGALIVAAGMSSRMGEFKPMLNIGSISIAQRSRNAPSVRRDEDSHGHGA